jgi:hypothetical protein
LEKKDSFLKNKNNDVKGIIFHLKKGKKKFTIFVNNFFTTKNSHNNLKVTSSNNLYRNIPKPTQIKEDEQEKINYKFGMILYDYISINDDEISCLKDEQIKIIKEEDNGWSLIELESAKQGKIPKEYYMEIDENEMKRLDFDERIEKEIKLKKLKIELKNKLIKLNIDDYYKVDIEEETEINELFNKQMSNKEEEKEEEMKNIKIQDLFSSIILSKNNKIDYEKINLILMIYKNFLTPKMLIGILKLFYNYKKKDLKTQNEINDFINNELIPIRLKITKILILWIEKYYYDFISM